jgi:hypothetical protein
VLHALDVCTRGHVFRLGNNGNFTAAWSRHSGTLKGGTDYLIDYHMHSWRRRIPARESSMAAGPAQSVLPNAAGA